MDRKIKAGDDEVTLHHSEHAHVGPTTIIMGINGESSNPNRHAITLSAKQARELAKYLNAVADLSN